MSDTDIAALTGIPRSTIGFVRRGERALPSEYVKPLYNTYRKVNYHILTDTGMPYHQARKYSSGSVKQSSEVAVEMTMIVTQSTRGAITGKTVALEKKGILVDPRKIESEMLVAVKRGYQKSHKDFEQHRDYLRKKAEWTTELHNKQEQVLLNMGW